MSEFKDPVYQDYIAHHGILGMKWGVRRYQNEDGSLTEKGKARFKEVSESSSEEKNKQIVNAHNALLKKSNVAKIEASKYINKYDKTNNPTKKEKLDLKITGKLAEAHMLDETIDAIDSGRIKAGKQYISLLLNENPNLVLMNMVDDNGNSIDPMTGKIDKATVDADSKELAYGLYDKTMSRKTPRLGISSTGRPYVKMGG